MIYEPETTVRPEDDNRVSLPRDVWMSYASKANDLHSFKGDVMAGCDIQRGDTLYRQKKVVIGPGLTEDELRIKELEAILEGLDYRPDC